MKQYGLRSIVAMRMVALVLATVALISLLANLLIGREFHTYVEKQQQREADDIAENISTQYRAELGDWNLDYVHGMGMYALNDGYSIRLYDGDKNVLWDAENHDMTLCAEMMHTIFVRREQEQPETRGQYITQRYDLKRAGARIGYLDISYYAPNYMKESDFQFLQALNQILLIVGGISLLGAAALGVLMADGIAKPVARVVAVTRQISQGSYEVRIEERGNVQELRELSEAVNDMAGALAAHEDLRRRLTSDMAHELRTPVANLSSYVEMMREGVLSPTPERLKSCSEELVRLSELIRDLDQLRELEDGRLTLNKTEFDLKELAQTVSGAFESALREKGMEVRIQGTEGRLFADRQKLQQVLTNLLSNAVKYSPAGGKITMSLSETPDTVLFEMGDQGPGIPAGEEEKIFERLYRADLSRNRKTGGAGIGLAIVKKIVEAHGGSVGVRSAAGEGSCFFVALPRGDS